MKKITDIKPQIKNNTRFNIYLDNVFYCGLELETIMKYRLKVGTEIEQEKLDTIQFDSENTRALDKAMNYLSRVKKTEKQVKEYLEKKGYTEKTVCFVIEKLKSYKFLCDEEFAEDYIRVYSKNKGKRLLKNELKMRGVKENDIDKALTTLQDESENASYVAEKYLRSKEKTKENFLKCYKYLIYKGFDYDTAKDVISKYKEYKDEDDNF